MRVKTGSTSRKHLYPATLAAGACLALGFPTFDIWPLTFLAPAVLIWALDGAGAKRGAVLGLLFGVGFFSVLIYWISIIGYLALVVLVLLQSLFVAAFGAVWGALSKERRWWIFRLAAPAVVWVAIVEYLRSVLPLRGFTWGQLAQGFHDIPYLLEFASLGGSWLLAGVTIVIATCIASMISASARRDIGLTIPGATVVALALTPLLIPAPSAEGRALDVAIVQGNVPREMEASRGKQLTILESHVGLTEDLAGDDLDLVVWPESSVGIDPVLEPEVGERIAEAARAAGAPMIVGANLDLPDRRYQVVALLLDAGGRLIDRYEKTHLVPFGEYVPARRFLDWIPALDQVPRDAVPSDEAVVFDLPIGPVAPVISFEGDFGSLVRGRIAAGGRLLVVATNTSTWEESSASAQHVAMSQVRAAENGVYVLHGALSGISAMIEPNGRVIARTGLWEATTLKGRVRLATGITPYARVGDIVAHLCVVSLLILAAVGARRKRQNR